MKRCEISYKEAESFIHEGDILLFRGQGWVSRLIQRASDGMYSHAALASWTYNDNGKRIALEALEFREFIGSRAISLKNYVAKNDGIIDVFRCHNVHYNYSFNCEERRISTERHVLNSRAITEEFRQLTGLPYGWARIWWLAKHHLLGWRVITRNGSYEDDLLEEDIYPVCSTIIAHCYHKHYTDLIRYRSDSRMEPSDLSRSPLLSYVFTLKK